MAKRSSKSGGTLHQWFKGSKSTDGKPGWVNVKTGGTCASDEPGEGVPKCVSSDKRASMTEKQRSSAQRRKRSKDPNQQNKSGAAKPTYVSTDSDSVDEQLIFEKDIKSKNSGKKDACYYKVKSRYRVWPSAYACVPENNSKALTKSGWKTVTQLNVNDEILTYNINKNLLEFKPILNLYRYKNVKTNIIGDKLNQFVFECSDNHKWVIQTSTDKILVETKDLLNNHKSDKLLVNCSSIENQDYISQLELKNISDLKLIEENCTDVWCPETENKTWIMKQEIDQNHIITITGNSGALVKCRKKGSKNWGEETTMKSNSKINENHKEIENGSEKDDEGYMANIELQSIERSVQNLKKAIKKRDQQIPAWVQSKITRATDYINTASEYLQSNDELKESKKNPLKDERFQLTNSRGAGALTPDAAKQLGPKAQELQKKRAGAVDLPKMRKESISLVDKILSEMECDCEMKPHKSPEEIAKKHKVSLAFINKQLKMGTKVEGEHTTDKVEAQNIALQHLDELPDYYSKLSKMEKKNVSESSVLPRQTGNVLMIVLSWRGKNIITQVFFPSLKMPTRNEIQYELNKIYPESRLLNYKVTDLRQDQPLIQVSNSKSKNYLLNNKTIGESFEYCVLNEFKTSAWQRSEGKNPEGGLNKKGIAAYRRENPGSKLSMAVTTKPSKLKPGSKKAKRRKSFCARMSGVKGPMRKNGKPTRKALALKKWNC